MSLFELLDGPDKEVRIDILDDILEEYEFTPDDLTKIKSGYKKRVPNYITAWAIIVDNGYGTNKNIKKAVKIYKLLPQRDDRDYHIGYNYLHGTSDFAVNYVKAKKYLERAVAGDNVCAKNELGLIYYEGYGVSKDYKMARKLFKEGNPPAAQYNRGLCYYYGVPKNIRKAIQYFESSGYGAAEFLGPIYFSGEDTNLAQNIDKGLILMIKSGIERFAAIIAENIKILLKWFQSPDTYKNYLVILANEKFCGNFKFENQKTQLIFDTCVLCAKLWIDRYWPFDDPAPDKECEQYQKRAQEIYQQMLNNIIIDITAENTVCKDMGDGTQTGC